MGSGWSIFDVYQAEWFQDAASKDIFYFLDLRNSDNAFSLLWNSIKSVGGEFGEMVSFLPDFAVGLLLSILGIYFAWMIVSFIRGVS